MVGALCPALPTRRQGCTQALYDFLQCVTAVCRDVIINPSPHILSCVCAHGKTSLIRTVPGTLCETPGAFGQRHLEKSRQLHSILPPILFVGSCVVLNDALPGLVCSCTPQKRRRSSHKRLDGCPAPVGVHPRPARELSERGSVPFQTQPLRHDCVHLHRAYLRQAARQ